MKFIYLILVSLLFSCSSSKQEDLSSDSTQVDSIVSHQETTAINTTDNNNIVTDDPIQDSVITTIINAYNETIVKFEQEKNQFYSASFNFIGYESGHSTTWYFDSLMNLKYCKGSWDMEGTGGSFAYYFDDENLIAAQVDDEGQVSSESKTIYTGTQPIYGFSITSGYEQENDTTYLYESGYSSINTEALEQFQKLLNYFSENNEKAIITEDAVIIEIENTVNYGGDFKEKESSDMSKPLYKKLIKN
jgi:hypothetical protein